MKMIQRLSLVSLLLYTMILMYWMLLGFGRRYTYSEYKYNLMPFETITHFLQTDRFNTSIWVVNIFGNIGVFVPFGILLPLLFGGKIKKSISIFMIGLFSLESLQFITRRGSFDIDDIILNSLGFLFGYCIYRVLALIFKR